MRSPQDEAVALFTRAAPTYDAVGPRFFTHFAKRLVELVGPRSGSQVLDVATGTGAVLLQVAEALGKGGHVIGVDLTPAMLERAQVELDSRALQNAELRLMDAQELEFEDDSFDYAFCAYTLVCSPTRCGRCQSFTACCFPVGA